MRADSSINKNKSVEIIEAILPGAVARRLYHLSKSIISRIDGEMRLAGRISL